MRAAISDPRRHRRLIWALNGLEQSLETALLRDTSERAAHLRDNENTDLVTALGELLMEEADPTSNKQFTPWLVREYAAGRLLLEDLGTANETLTLFQRYAPRLKPEARDIQRYGSLAAAWEVVRGFAERDEAHSNKAQKALDRAKAYEESRILRQDPDGFTVAVPLTEFAAKWWGKGTRWCTAAEKNNVFWRYHAKAPLFVILIPEVGKFQMWVTPSSFTLMDAADQPVSAKMSRALWQWLKPVWMAALEVTGSVLRYIPVESRSHEICRNAVRQEGRALLYVTKEHQTHDIFLIAVQQTSEALQWVPEEQRTYDLCLAAVRQYGSALEWVPNKHLTPELCLVAVKQNGWALQWVPKARRTYGLCLDAVQRDGMALKWVPSEHRSPEVCLAAVQENAWALQWVPEEHFTPALYIAAVQQDGGALYLVPEEHRTYQLCLVAVQQNGGALLCVPEERRNHDLCVAAVHQNGGALRWVPQEHRTQEICRAAVQQVGLALKWVPEEHRSYELCLAAVVQDAMTLEYLPRAHRTHEIYLAALVAHRAALEFIPDHLHAELLAKLPPEPAPTIEWSDTLLDTWAERLKPLPDQTVTPHA